MLFYKCLKDKAMNIEINQYSYLSPKKFIISKNDLHPRSFLLYIFFCVYTQFYKTDKAHNKAETIPSCAPLIF